MVIGIEGRYRIRTRFKSELITKVMKPCLSSKQVKKITTSHYNYIHRLNKHNRVTAKLIFLFEAYEVRWDFVISPEQQQ